MLNPSKTALNQYRQIDNQAQVSEASPQKLIQMLMAGALEKINTAKRDMEMNDIAGKGDEIGRAIDIVEGLRVSLNESMSGQLGSNLSSLYQYMTRRLVQANLDNDPAILDEVAGLLKEIKSAWDVVTERTVQSQ